MISDKKLAPMLLEAKESDVILAGTLLKGLSDEQIAWRVVESVAQGNYRRITLHAYWHDVFIVSKIAKIGHLPNNGIEWGATGGKA